MPPPARTGSGLKILFVVLAILGILGIMAVGGIWYAWHRAKEFAASKGVDVSAFTETQRGPARRVNACDLLTKDDLSQILSLSVDRSDGTGKSTNSVCRYYSSQAQQRAQEEAVEAKKKIEEAAKAGNGAPTQAQIDQIGNMVRGIAGAAGAGADAPMLTITVDTQGAKAAMAAFKLAMGMTGAVVMQGQKSPNGTNIMTEDVKGVGDEAVIGPMLSLSMFRKGDVAVQIDGRLLPGGRDAQIAIAKRIFEKL